MFGAALSPAPLEPGSPPPTPDEDELFTASLVASNPRKLERTWWGTQVSLVAHVVCVASLILVPIFWPSPSPDQGDPLRILIYDPPPPPPPPLPQGSSLARKTETAKPVTPDPQVKVEPKFVAPIEQPQEKPLTPENKAPADQQFGSETGDQSGVAEGMEGGVVGGQVGG
ncbi:MAG: hypothetical protein ACHQKZ_04885, partial [Solirubrobacterales bacterium]